MADKPPKSGQPPSFEPDVWPDPESARERAAQAALPREELRRTLPVRPADAPPTQGAFPDDAELEYERSVIRIPFYLKGEAAQHNPRGVDVMAFDAYMRILRESPIRNGIGLRQFEFYIDAWELNNTYSKSLETNITFTLADTTQPKSLCVALQRDADYPAMIVYNAIYDVYMGKEKIIDRQAGTAVATPVYSIPPRHVTVAFEKPFDSELFAFRAGVCEGMRSVSADEFQRGATEARLVREG